MEYYTMRILLNGGLMMIHNVLLVETVAKEVVASEQFWEITFSADDLLEFLDGLFDLESSIGLSKDTPLYAGTHRVFHRKINPNMTLMFCTDGTDEVRTLEGKIAQAAAQIEKEMRENNLEYIRENFRTILGESIFTRFKISFVGSGGVGKSTLMRLLFGKDPSPGGYVPTINVSVDSSLIIEFGTFKINVWDFAGQAVFQDIWDFYFQGTDIIFLVTDSSLSNVYSKTKSILKQIRKEAPAVPVFIIANKQDMPESLEAIKIQRLLGVKTLPMIATDPENRSKFMEFMIEVICKSRGIEAPSFKPIIRGDDEDAVVVPVSTKTHGPSIPLAFLVIGVDEHNRQLIYSVDYREKMSDIRTLESLVRALDSSDILQTIEHDNSTILVERSNHFIAALFVTNQGLIEHREILRRIVESIEIQSIDMENHIEDWSVFEKSVYHLLQDLPVALLDLNHILETSITGFPMLFENLEFNSYLSAIYESINGCKTVSELLTHTGLPHKIVYAILQLLIAYGWARYSDMRMKPIISKEGRSSLDI